MIFEGEPEPVPPEDGTTARTSVGRGGGRRDPLYRSSTALLLNSAATSLVGMAFWVLAARRYSASVVGASSAVISVMLLLANVAELNLTSVLVRFLPTSGGRTRAFIISSYATAAGIGILLSAAALPFLKHLAVVRQLLALGPGGGFWFVAAVGVWCLFALQDAVAIALRGATWVPVENASYGLVKLGVLVAVASSLPRLGIFASWTIPMALTIPAMNFLIFVSLLPRHRKLGGVTENVSMRHVRTFITFEYFTSLVATAATTLIQLLVLTRLGATNNAYFYVVWVTAGAFDGALNNVGSSLVAEASRSPARIAALTRVLTRHVGMLLIPVVTLLFVGAPVLLSLFGSAYSAHSTTLLRLLAVAVVPRLIITLWMSVNRVHRQVGRIFAVQGALGGILIGGSALALYLRPSIDVVGVTYLACQTVVAAVILPSLVQHMRGQRFCDEATVDVARGDPWSSPG